MIIQILLIAFSIVFLIYFLSDHNSIQMRAYKKVGLFVFALGLIAFVLFPESLNKIAHWFGVGRGADLLLYFLFIGFIGFAMNVYLKFKAQQDLVYRLARKIAILEATKQDSKDR